MTTPNTIHLHFLGAHCAFCDGQGRIVLPLPTPNPSPVLVGAVSFGYVAELDRHAMMIICPACAGCGLVDGMRDEVALGHFIV
jgi:hypothetical protein